MDRADLRPLPLAAAEEWWSRLALGDIDAVRYVDDEVAHERLIVLVLRSCLACTVTPDGDRYVEDLAARDPQTGPESAV